VTSSSRIGELLHDHARTGTASSQGTETSSDREFLHDYAFVRDYATTEKNRSVATMPSATSSFAAQEATWIARQRAIWKTRADWNEMEAWWSPYDLTYDKHGDSLDGYDMTGYVQRELRMTKLTKVTSKRRSHHQGQDRQDHS
jgi:hypothetical protein